MIAKISKGGSFGGAVDYVLDKGKDAELLAGLGVRMKDRDSIVRSFRMQAALNPHLSKPVGHIVLAFSAQDAARLDNRRMVGIAAEYLSGMGIRNTQFIIARHRDREHPHLHILFNRVDNDGRTVSDRNDRYRSERLCKELTVRHGLYLQGVVFARNGYPFNGSKIDRQFSFSKIDHALSLNRRQALSANERGSVSNPVASFSHLLEDLLQPVYDADEERRLQERLRKKRKQHRL